ncbi:MAG: hypothetical protein ACE5FT_00150 [Candidatus Nanoarchaeia archaeon]
MNPKIKALLKNARMIVLIIALILAIVAIHPRPMEGVAVRNVLPNSTAAMAGMDAPSSKATPVDREVILTMDSTTIKGLEDYRKFVDSLEINQSFTIETNTGYYQLMTQPNIVETDTNETELVLRNITEGNETVEKLVEEPIILTEVDGVADLGLSVYPAPQNNLRKGLELQGGTRVLLQPEEQVSEEDMDSLVDSLGQRLNIFGLSDIIVRKSTDLSGNQYILVEIAGANEEEVKDLVSSQGKFEALIANQTVFKGGEDITYVCRSAQCSGIDPNVGCQGSPGSFSCRFFFQISLSPDAAQKQADVTAGLDVRTDESGSRYLSEPILLFLDNKEVDSLQIAESLKGRPVTDISITGSGQGASQQEAMNDAIQNMKGLQTILITGSLPVKLNIVRSRGVSPELGESFLQNALLMSLLSILAVATVVFTRYRLFSISIPMVITMLSELVLLLGFAALFRWNLDLAAIAGILIAVGTGVDDQIVITDETLNKEDMGGSWTQQLKKAFFIIFAAYATTMVAMGPLYFAGAGLLRGFALTTMAGVTFGVFITRPAFAAMVKILLDR